MSPDALTEKPLIWMGNSFADLVAFPVDARRQAGYELGRVQLGLEPLDWKPFGGIGPGVCEIRIRTAQGAYRVMYVARFEEAVYVLHCFEKRSQRTTTRDKGLAASRYADIPAQRRQHGTR